MLELDADLVVSPPREVAENVGEALRDELLCRLRTLAKHTKRHDGEQKGE
jgi:hypothetical protein